jgi:dipeptide/tripeptide permease
MLSGLAVPWIGLALSWRVPYLITAGLGVVMMLVAPHFETVNTVGETGPKRITPALAAFMVTAAIGGGVGNSLASFVTDASVTRGFTEVSGARMLTAGSIVAIAVRIGAGLVADRRRRSGLAELVFLLAVAVAGLGLLGSSGDSDTMFVVGVLAAFAGSWGWQGVMFFAAINIIRMPPATTTGAVAAGAYLGTMIVPPLIGSAADRWSYDAVFEIAALTMIAAIAAALASAHLARSRQPAPGRPH